MAKPASIPCACSVRGEGPPLFLIHGIGAARNTWAKLMPILTPFFTVVTYDLRGHGESPLPDGEFGLDDLVEDLEYIRQETGFEKAQLRVFTTSPFSRWLIIPVRKHISV